MSKNSSVKYYQNNKERPQKNPRKSLYKDEKENMVENDTKIYLKMKNQSFLSIICFKKLI